MLTRRRAMALLGASAGALAPGWAAGQNLVRDNWWSRVDAEDAAFDSEGVTLRGGYYSLPGAAPRAGIVLVQGAGEQPRMDGVARWFAANGFAVLTWDKRGVGESGGVYEGVNNVSAKNLRLLVADAAAAMRWAAARPELQDRPIGFIGFSQAGWIVPPAVTQADRADFIVMWSAPVGAVLESLEFEANSATATPELPALIDRVRAEGSVDPLPHLRAMRIPGFWVWGDEDDAVPVPLSRERLSALIAEGHDFEYAVLPGLGHNLMDRQFEPTISWLHEKLGV